MKKILILCMCVLFVFSCGKENSDGVIELKMSVTTSESSTWTLGAQKFAEIVYEKSDGKIVVDVFPNEQLSGGNQSKGIEMLSTGVIDISLHSNMIYSIMDEKFGMISLPWLFDNVEEIDVKLSGEAGEAIKELAREKGIECLAFGENGFRQISNNKQEIRNPSDVENLKIRVPNVRMLMSTFKSFGSDPIAMNFSEVFSALQLGTIDGQENPTDVIVSSKIYEVQKYLTVWNYCYDALLLSMNKEKFDSLSPEMQKVISESAIEAAEFQRELNREKASVQLDFFADETSMEVLVLTPEEIEAFRKIVAPVYEEYTPIMGTELMSLFTE